MSNKKLLTKTILLVIVIACFIPSILTPIIAENNHNNDFSLNTEYDKAHDGFIYVKETLSGLVDTDTHKMYLKEGKEYYFSAKFDNPDGTSLTLIVANGIDVAYDHGDWDESTPKRYWKIELRLTPTSADSFTIVVNEFDALNNIDTNYTLYGNRSGIAGYWWMILSGIGVLVVLILIILLIVRIAKPKKKRKRKN